MVLHTPWSRVLLEKLTGPQLVKKFPAFYVTWRFITALTRASYLFLSWAISIQSMPPHPTSWREMVLGQIFLRLSRFVALSIPHQCSILIFILIPLLFEAQADAAWKPSRKEMPFRILEQHWTEMYCYIVFMLQRVTFFDHRLGTLP
jgi:hypothetical protein